MKYVILRPVEPPRICFLKEALNWCAFGSYPTGYWDIYGNDSRENPEEPELFYPPIPDHDEGYTYLSEEQTKMAGLPPDPTYVNLMNDCRPFYRYELDEINERIADGQRLTPEQSVKHDAAKKFRADYDEWLQLHDAYIDQFRTELLLALRKGQLTAHGRKLPHTDRDKARELFDKQESYTESIEPEVIPPEFWVSNFVDWDECSITSPRRAFVWISIEVSKLLERFPPNELIPAEKLSKVGECYAIAERAFAERKKSTANTRGRPALPWDRFYVEVARLYKDNEMPEKKEAAIQHFQTWFEQELGLQASRSAIGQKLKPFFDRLSEA